MYDERKNRRWLLTDTEQLLECQAVVQVGDALQQHICIVRVLFKKGPANLQRRLLSTHHTNSYDSADKQSSPFKPSEQYLVFGVARVGAGQVCIDGKVRDVDYNGPLEEIMKSRGDFGCIERISCQIQARGRVEPTNKMCNTYPGEASSRQGTFGTGKKMTSP